MEMKDLLTLSDEELFEELVDNWGYDGCDDGVYFSMGLPTAQGVTVYFDNDDIKEYVDEHLQDELKEHTNNGEWEPTDDDYFDMYWLDDKKADKHFFMQQVDNVRDQIKEIIAYSELKI